MTLIEQAILASVGEEDPGGCRVVAASAGLCADDRRELAAWGPSCDGLWGADAGRRTSINFHPLPSGSFCISRTTLAGWEDGDRVPRRASTHCLVVAAAGLRPFANNPLAVVEEAAAAGAFDAPAYAPAALQPLQLDGGAPVVERGLAGRGGRPARPRAIGDAGAGGPGVRLFGRGGGAAGPSACGRGAELSPPGMSRRVLLFHRVEVRPAPPLPDHRPASRPGGKGVAGAPPQRHPPGPRPVLPERRGVGRLGPAHREGRRQGRLRLPGCPVGPAAARAAPGDLSALGLQLCDELDLSPLERGDPMAAARAREQGGNALRAHAAHHRFEKSAEAATAVRSAGAVPSKDLATETPEVLETLEALDDAVYDAIHGHAAALERLQALWPTALAHLGEQFLAESRVQYLRYALTVWENCVERPRGSRPGTGGAGPGRPLHALRRAVTLMHWRGGQSHFRRDHAKRGARIGTVPLLFDEQ